MTPLHIAVLWDKPKFIPILLNHGASEHLDIKVVNGNQREISGMSASEFANFLLAKSDTLKRREIINYLSR